MTEYLITLFGQTENRTLKLGYREGKMVLFQVPDEFDAASLPWLHNWLWSQLDESKMLENIHDTSLKVRFRADLMQVDTSFNAFWNAYNYKVGNKKTAEKHWNTLNEETRVAVLKSIPRYDAWLRQKTKQDKIYPERYLGQSRWENEYKI